MSRGQLKSNLLCKLLGYLAVLLIIENSTLLPSESLAWSFLDICHQTIKAKICLGEMFFSMSLPLSSIVLFFVLLVAAESKFGCVMPNVLTPMFKPLAIKKLTTDIQISIENYSL